MSDTTVPPARFARTRPVIAAGGLDALAVRLVQRGFLQGDAAGAPFLVQPSDILVLDLAQPSNFASAPSTETQEVTLWLPRDSMSVHGTDEDTLHGVVLHGSSPGGAVVGAALAALAQHAGGMNVREMDALAGGTIGLIASALGPELHKRRPSIGPTAATLARIRRFIEAHLASPALETDMLAGEFGLSRSALYCLSRWAASPAIFGANGCDGFSGISHRLNSQTCGSHNWRADGASGIKRRSAAPIARFSG